jgi:hypothetical protein
LSACGARQITEEWGELNPNWHLEDLVHSTRRFGLPMQNTRNISFLIKNTAKTRGVKTSSEAQDCGWSMPTAWELRTSCHGNGVGKRQNPPFFWLHFVD